MVKKNLNQKLQEFCRHTTLVAIPNIFLTSRPAFKFIYTISLIASTGVCGLFIYSSFVSFFNHEIKTLVTLKSSDSTTNFPTITICNLQICGFKNYAYSELLDRYKKNETEKLSSDQSAFVDERLRKNQTKTSYYSAQEIFLRQYNDTELEKNLNKVNASIKSMLLSCRYGDFADNRSYCDETDFQVVPIGEFRKCFQFNALSLDNQTNKTSIRKITTQNGKHSGLQLELFIGSEANCKSPLTTTSGLAIYVHDYTYTLTEEDNAIQVQPGTEANIAVDRTEIKQLPEPYGGCYDNNKSTKTDLIIKTLNLTGSYTQQYCLQLCFEEFLVEFCDCYDNSVPLFAKSYIVSSKNLKTCPKFIDSIYNCEYLIKKLFYNGINDKACLEICPKECEYVTYKTSVSYSKYPSDDYMELLSNNLTTKYVIDGVEDLEMKKENLVSLNIFYKNSKYKTIEEQPAIELDIFVVNFGGTLGLFLGCSVLSFLELFEILIEFILHRFNA